MELTLLRYCRLRPYGPESVGANYDVSKYGFSQCHRRATACWFVLFSSVCHVITLFYYIMMC